MNTLKNALGVAVVGAGYWGPNLIRNFVKIPDCKVRWICDQKPGRLHYAGQKWPEIPRTDDYSRVIGDPDVHAVILATPVSTHFELGMSALQAGKHVFIEKPLTRKVEEAKTLVDTAETRNLILAVGHIFVFHPAVTAMKTAIDTNGIGKLCYAESGRVNLGPPASEVNVVWDLAVHDISILLHLWGRLPSDVRAQGRNFLHSSLTDVAFINLRFPDGSMSNHHVSWMSPEKVRRFFVSGTEGSLQFDATSSDKPLRIIDQGVDSRIDLKDDDVKELFYKPGKVHEPDFGNQEPLYLECRQFLDCIRSGRRPLADGRSGLDVVKVLEAVEESIRTGSNPVPLN